MNEGTKVIAMLTMLRHFANDESGATAIEYGLIAALVSVGAIAGFDALSDSLVNVFGHVATTIAPAASP